jgi:hypothetical protein
MSSGSDNAKLETIVLRMIRNDPFTSISEMKRAINRMPNVEPAGWWRIFSILRKNKLLTKRARFRFIRDRR